MKEAEKIKQEIIKKYNMKPSKLLLSSKSLRNEDISIFIEEIRKYRQLTININ